MASQTDHSGPPVRLVETTGFERDVGSHLTPTEYRGLCLILADNPMVGTAVPRRTGLRDLKYAQCSVTFAVSPDLRTVYLLQIIRTDASQAPGDPADESKVRTALGLLTKGGVFAVGKKAVEWVWDILTGI